ncbi:unnamed protein product [Trichobilharzia regenti]|nr:unnamed protein product [Trichobilharzia regenti]
MWNMQRVLLFTQDVNVAKNARLSSDLEPIDQEVVISLQSIGISLVDNTARAEIAYVSITRLVRLKVFAFTIFILIIFLLFFYFFSHEIIFHTYISSWNKTNIACVLQLHIALIYF